MLAVQLFRIASKQAGFVDNEAHVREDILLVQPSLDDFEALRSHGAIPNSEMPGEHFDIDNA